MFRLIEFLLGRSLFWRISRSAYLHARREGSLDINRNGESWLQRAFAQRMAQLARPLVVVDVGANYGQWSTSLLTALDRAAALPPSLTMFEPVPAIRTALEAKMSNMRTSSLTIVPCALSDRPGALTMTINGIDAGTHHLGSMEAGETGTEVEVNVATLDDYWSEHGGGPIDFVKIDAEGYDVNVLRGMGRLMGAGTIDAIQFEYSGLFYRTRSFLRDVMTLAADTGYRFGNLSWSGIELLDEWHYDVESLCSSTKVLIHPRALEWLSTRPVTYSRYNTLVPA